MTKEQNCTKFGRETELEQIQEKKMQTENQKKQNTEKIRKEQRKQWQLAEQRKAGKQST